MNLNSIARALYTAARLTRDLNAVTRGPAAIAARLVRKGLGRLVNGPINRM